MTSKDSATDKCTQPQEWSWIPSPSNKPPKWHRNVLEELSYLYSYSNLTAHQLQVIMTASHNMDCKGDRTNGELVRGKIEMALTGQVAAHTRPFKKVAKTILNDDTAAMDEAYCYSTIACLEFCVNMPEKSDHVPEAWKQVQFLEMSCDNVKIERNEERLRECMNDRAYWS